MSKKDFSNIEVKKLPAFTIACVRHVGPYKGDANLFAGLFNKITAFAGPRNLITGTTKFVAVYHDDPSVTPESELKLDVGISVPTNTEVTGEISKMDIPEGEYAVAHFEINDDQYEESWNRVFAEWLPESGYQPTEGVCYEHYLNDPKEHPQGKHIVDICIPVKKA